MTLQASGVISLANINTELQRSSTALLSLNDSQARDLAGRPSGIISVSDFYNKTWLTAADATTWVVNNKSKAHSWVFGSGVTAVNNPYDRYTSSTNWTYYPGTISGVTSKNTTIIVITLENGAGVPSVSTNLGSGSQNTVYSTGVSGGLNIQRVVISSDVKNLTYVSSTWGHSNSNNGTWASCIILPGNWTASLDTGDVTLANSQIIIGGSTTDVGDGPQYSLTSAGGMPSQYFTAWWYNSCGHWMVANNTGSSKIASLTGEAYSALLSFSEA